MGFFDLRRKQLTDDELRSRLFDAAERSDMAELKTLLTQHKARVDALFPGWTTLPPSVRSEPSMTRWWAQGIIAVASMAAELGDASMLTRLVGPPQDNFLIQWQEAFVAAEAAAAAGDYLGAIAGLEPFVDEARGMTGSGPDHLLPKTYGLLGMLYYRNGNDDDAREWTLKARDYCERIGDREGVNIYTNNLAVLAGEPRH